MRLLIKNGTVVTAADLYRADVLITGVAAAIVDYRVKPLEALCQLSWCTGC